MSGPDVSRRLRSEDPTTVPAAERQAALGERVRSLRLPSEVRSRCSGSNMLPWILCFLLTGAAVGLGYLYYQQLNRGKVDVVATRADNTQNMAQSRSFEATTGGSLPGSAGPIALESKGYIVPRRQILVSPQVSGRLLKVLFEEGQRVDRDQLLAEIETTEYEAERARAEAGLESAKQRLSELERGYRPEEIAQAEAELEEAKANLRQLEAAWKRNEELRRSRTISPLEYEQSEAAYLAAKQRIDRLQAAVVLIRKGPREERIAAAKWDVRQARAELERAQWRRDNCTVRAPITGTILRKNAEEGNIVNPVAFNGSYSLCEMADLSDLEVELYIQERDVARVFVGQHCQVRAEAYQNRVYEGVVSRLMPIADRAKGAVPVRVKLTVPAEEEGVYLKPEMGAVVTFLNVPSKQKAAPNVPHPAKPAA